MGWACGTYGGGEGVYRVLVGKLEGRRPLGRHRCRWGDNIRMDREEWDGLDMWHVWVRREGCIGFWWGNRREGNHWGDLGVDGWIILRWIEKNEMGWACGAYGGGEGVYRVWVGKPEGRRALGRHRRRWVDNIRMDREE